jgi:hypothetical protein
VCVACGQAGAQHTLAAVLRMSMVLLNADHTDTSLPLLLLLLPLCMSFMTCREDVLYTS